MLIWRWAVCLKGSSGLLLPLPSPTIKPATPLRRQVTLIFSPALPAAHHQQLRACVCCLPTASWRQRAVSSFNRLLGMAREEEMHLAHGSARWASGGGESAKEKRLRRMLKKLNTSADSKETHSAAGEREERRPAAAAAAADRGRAAEESRKAAAAAEQQMLLQLQRLEMKLKELQVTRPQPETFERIQVQVAAFFVQSCG
ncbi:hypothetical protein Efla_003919 [Eimeria flavescens]